MQRSKGEIYLHFVWSTWRRQPLIPSEMEESLYRCIAGEVTRLKATILALNGMPDHVHLLVKLPTTISAAQIMQQVKGVSSAFGRDQYPDGGLFGWQDNYAVFSISRSHVKKVIAYIENQKRHHANNTIWPEWEQTEEQIEKSNSHNPVREDG